MTANVSNGAQNAVTTAHNHINAQHVEELALRMVGWSSETGTPEKPNSLSVLLVC